MATNDDLPFSQFLAKTLQLAHDKSSPTIQPKVVSLRNATLPRLQLLETKVNAQPILKQLAAKTRLPPAAWIASLSLICSIFAIRYGRQRPLLLTNLIAVLYPAFRSICAVETPQQDEDERLLTYWSIFGLLTFVDAQAETMKRRFRFYYLPKVIFLYWLFQGKGALLVYRRVFRPLLYKYGKVRLASPSRLHPLVQNEVKGDKPNTDLTEQEPESTDAIPMKALGEQAEGMTTVA